MEAKSAWISSISFVADRGLLWLCLPSLGEAAFGETFPPIANVILGRGFNHYSKTIKEYMLKKDYTREVSDG